MKKSRFTETQITGALKAYEAGKDIQQICREMNINRATFYNWKKKYSGMDADLLRQFKELQRENTELKRMYADLSLDHNILKKVIEKSFRALSKAVDGCRDCSGRTGEHCQGLPGGATGPVAVLLSVCER